MFRVEFFFVHEQKPAYFGVFIQIIKQWKVDLSTKINLLCDWIYISTQIHLTLMKCFVHYNANSILKRSWIDSNDNFRYNILISDFLPVSKLYSNLIYACCPTIHTVCCLIFYSLSASGCTYNGTTVSLFNPFISSVVCQQMNFNTKKKWFYFRMLKWFILCNYSTFWTMESRRDQSVKFNENHFLRDNNLLS